MTEATSDPIGPLQGPALGARLDALARWLIDRRPIWAHRPFLGATAPWQAEAPALEGWLLSRTAAQIAALEAGPGPAWAAAPEPARSMAAESAALTAIGPLPRATPRGRPPERRVRARKRGQIRGFVEVAAATAPPEQRGWVDWCAGKGYLARSLVAGGGAAICVERRGELCEAGARAAAEEGVDCQFIEADARTPEALTLLGAPRGAAALHACGGLGDAMLEGAAAARAPTILLATCCYHKVDGVDWPDGAGPEIENEGPVGARYRPRSRSGRALDPGLGVQQLRLATAQESVSRPALRARRHRRNAWRMGLMALVAEASGGWRYLPIAERSELDLPFEGFASALSDAEGWPLPARWDPAAAEARGWSLADRARALAAPRGLARRPMELWLVLDRAAALAEAGYAVAVGAFCAPEHSPRDLMIAGILDGAPRASAGGDDPR